MQRWDSNSMMIENGVYLGQLAALTFRGPFVMSGVRALSPSAVCCVRAVCCVFCEFELADIMHTITIRIAPDKPVHGCRVGWQRKLTFTFDKLRIRLGPKWLEFPLQAGQLGTTCAPFQTLSSASGMHVACAHAGISCRWISMSESHF